VPQVATAPLNTEHKTASFIRVAATPVPFTMPQEQIDALAGAQVSSVAPAALPTPTPKSFPSPLPGAIQVTTDRISNQTSTVTGTAAAAPIAKAALGGTVDFTCNSCNARLRLPAHYAGKSILCPKCSTPQKVLVSQTAVPMDTTRSIALREEAATATPQNPGPGVGTGAIAGTGTGMRVRVTPLPTTYPTPLPTAVTSPQTDVLGLTRPSPFASPAAVLPESTPLMNETPIVAAPEVELTSVIDAIASSTAEGDEVPVKPHPSHGKLKTEAISRPTPTSAPTPHVSAPKMHGGLFIAAGVLLVLAIALAAGLTYYAMALGETRSRLDEAQRIAKESAEREHTATKKASELDNRIAELEAALKAATEKAAADKAAVDKNEVDKNEANKSAAEKSTVTPDAQAAEPVIPTPAEEPPK